MNTYTKFILPFAEELCLGKGYDISGKKISELPTAIALDTEVIFDPELVDYIFSSHYLAKTDNWATAVMDWAEHLKPGGRLFLYIPDFSYEYWRPWYDSKYKHIITAEHINTLLTFLKFKDIRISGVDLNYSYVITGIAP